MKVKVFYHDRCFDGASSAALFSRFYQERIRNDVEFVYSGLLHRAGALFNEADFDGEENAIVDFKYSSSPKITWWFDHHESAFLTPADAAHFEQDQSNRKFYDPGFKSCTSFIAMIADQRFGFHRGSVAELVHWADIIDGALYPDAKTAVEMKAPAMQLTMVIESMQDPAFIPRLIPLLATTPLAEVIAGPLRCSSAASAARTTPAIRSACSRSAPNPRTQRLFFDITDLELEGYNKFVPYYLHPESVYSVGLSKSSFRVKVSVGSNPWAPSPPVVNLAKICERYGGGGHARVGAISFDVSQSAGSPPGGAGNRRRASRQRARTPLHEFRHSSIAFVPRAAKSTAPGCGPCARWRSWSSSKACWCWRRPWAIAFFVDATDVAEWFLRLLHISPDRHFAQLLLRWPRTVERRQSLGGGHGSLRLFGAALRRSLRTVARPGLGGMDCSGFGRALSSLRNPTADASRDPAARGFSDGQRCGGRIHVLPAHLSSRAGAEESPPRTPSSRIHCSRCAIESRNPCQLQES